MAIQYRYLGFPIVITQKLPAISTTLTARRRCCSSAICHWLRPWASVVSRHDQAVG
jgi:hypothetical protein